MWGGGGGFAMGNVTTTFGLSLPSRVGGGGGRYFQNLTARH